MKKLWILLTLIVASCSYGPVYADVFDSCIFMRSVRFSDPHGPDARAVFEDCTKGLTEDQKLGVIAEWPSRWKEEVRKDNILSEQIRAEEYHKNVRWSGCKPVRVLDGHGRWSPELQRRFNKLYCP